MTPILSIVIACHNDAVEIEETVRSIILTTPEQAEFEIVVVNDASTDTSLLHLLERYLCVRVVTNRLRVGCGPSRYIGACAARGEWLLFTDSHMRFTPGWFEMWSKTMCSDVQNANTLYCGSCLGLDVNNMDVAKAKAYYGGTLNVYGRDKNNKMNIQVLAGIWANEQPGDAYEIAVAIGACYFIRKDFFMKLNCLWHLRHWGQDEEFLSIKTWLSGGRVVFLKQVRIGHKFKSGKLNKINPSDVVYNQLFAIHTLMPEPLRVILDSKMPRSGLLTQARRKLFEDRHLVAIQRAYNGTIFKRDFYWMAEKFGLQLPT